MKKFNYPICFSSFFGGAIAVIIDLLSNDNAAVTLKMRAMFANHFAWKIGGEWIILLIAVIPPIVCWILETPSRKEAFMTGLSVFAFLNVTAPYKGENRQEAVPTSPTAFQTEDLSQFSSWRYQVSGKTQNRLLSNATIISNDWISSCKPSSSGVAGWKSLVNNEINYCPVDDRLKPRERVRIVALFDTSLRGYRYVKVQYERNNRLKSGWIWAGKGPSSYWTQILPDDEDNPTQE